MTTMPTTTATATATATATHDTDVCSDVCSNCNIFLHDQDFVCETRPNGAFALVCNTCYDNQYQQYLQECGGCITEAVTEAVTETEEQ
jgi:hypothetical protein